jgi:hypothetical protein
MLPWEIHLAMPEHLKIWIPDKGTLGWQACWLNISTNQIGDGKHRPPISVE